MYIKKPWKYLNPYSSYLLCIVQYFSFWCSLFIWFFPSVYKDLFMIMNFQIKFEINSSKWVIFNRNARYHISVYDVIKIYQVIIYVRRKLVHLAWKSKSTKCMFIKWRKKTRNSINRQRKHANKQQHTVPECTSTISSSNPYIQIFCMKVFIF